MITFPTPAADYATTPWTDTATGTMWLYHVGKTRWMKFAAIYTFVQEATPVGTHEGQQWFDTSDGSVSYWNASAQAWIAVSGPSGANALEPTVTVIETPPHETEIIGLPFVDETIFIRSNAGDRNLLTLLLPGYANCRLGQVKVLMADVSLTNLTVATHGTLAAPSGLTLTTAVALQSYSYQCWYRSGGVSSWLRIS